MQQPAFCFPLDGSPVECRELPGGQINRSFLVTTDRGARYVLQRVNRYVFPNICAVMQNAEKIGDWMARRPDAFPAAIRYLPTAGGATWIDDEQGGSWRCYRYVEHSLCLPKPESPADLEQGGIAFGRFLQTLEGFPAEELEETIPHFHDTPERYRQLRRAAEQDPCGRLAGAGDALEEALARESAASRLHALRLSGALPLRVTHNDTKFGNVLLDETTRRALCVIDLDTVMPGLSAFDFGDAIRSAAAVGTEDEPDSLDLGRFAAFTRGFLAGCPGLTAEERAALPLGAYTMSVELGVRFLTDHLLGDPYFTVTDAGRNLRRARRHFRLASDMQRKREQMAEIVDRAGCQFT